jgi:surfeit locus 1 family protein
VLVLAFGLAAVALRLGVWQLDRLAGRREANAVIAEARALPRRHLGPADLEALRNGMAVRVTGTFHPAGELLLRNRVHREAPGVHVVTPFRVGDSDRSLWVLRGFALAADGVHPDTVPAPTVGQVTLEGEVHALPVTEDGGQMVISAGDSTWRRLDSAMAAARVPRAAPFLLYLAGGASGPGALPGVEPPQLDEGPHLSYALQWFGIALAIAAFALFIVLRRPSDRGPAPPPGAP